MPSQTFTHREVAPISPAQAWAALQKVETWGEIGGVISVTDAVVDEAGLSGYQFTAEAAGTRYHGRAQRLAAIPEGQMTMGIETEQLTGRISVTLAEAGGGTAVGLTMEMSSRGMMTAMLFPVIAGSVGRGFPAVASRFVASLAEA